MKKINIYAKLSLLVLTGSIITLSACDNQSEEAHNEAIKNGLDALISENYDKAEVYFEIASEEKDNDERTQTLLAQTVSFNQAKKLFNEGDLMKASEKAQKVVGLSNGSEALVEKASALVEDVDKVNNKTVTFQSIYDEANQLFIDGKNEEALEKIERLLQEEEIRENYYVTIKEPSDKLKSSIEMNLSEGEVIGIEEKEELTETGYTYNDFKGMYALFEATPYQSPIQYVVLLTDSHLIDGLQASSYLVSNILDKRVEDDLLQIDYFSPETEENSAGSGHL